MQQESMLCSVEVCLAGLKLLCGWFPQGRRANRGSKSLLWNGRVCPWPTATHTDP